MAWEFLLASELLKSRLEEINRSYLELEKGLVFQKDTTLFFSGVYSFGYVPLWQIIQRLSEIFKKVFEDELAQSLRETRQSLVTFLKLRPQLIK